MQGGSISTYVDRSAEPPTPDGLTRRGPVAPALRYLRAPRPSWLSAGTTPHLAICGHHASAGHLRFAPQIADRDVVPADSRPTRLPADGRLTTRSRRLPIVKCGPCTPAAAPAGNAPVHAAWSARPPRISAASIAPTPRPDRPRTVSRRSCRRQCETSRARPRAPSNGWSRRGAD